MTLHARDEPPALTDSATPMAPFVGCVEELAAPDSLEPWWQRLSALPHCLFFDSARHDGTLGRYSFLTADPWTFVRAPADGSDVLPRLATLLARYRSPTLADLPPFQGGLAGLFGYDLAHGFERLPRPAHDEFAVPAVAVGLYDVVLAVDHDGRRAWIISHGWPQREPGQRRRRARARLEQFRQWLLASPATQSARAWRGSTAVAPQQLAPQFAVPAALPRLTSNFSREGYLEAVARAIEYIRAGDVFQVNLAQRLLYPAQDDPIALYQRLRRRNPAPLGGYFDLGDFQILSASPERFLRVAHGEVEARPIKGTRRRTAQPEADLFAGDELRGCEKDRAENMMIVDLLRNDLSRVCLPESVQVSDLCRLETFAFVQHLVSVIRGRLRPGLEALDLLRAAFPGGSITGAPKVRAMQIIAELEPTARGAYCGSLAYVGFDGTMDASILIRTITAGRGWWQMPVGGGIVVQSDPQREWEETWDKAEGMLRALT